ncbi:Thioredoxin domain-containing protein [Evansella caseinilytica]|uniref:Thioredoxin domain-containing protein n=1 Tax=Evansella caseinilytica TaxID=1503961 RepID=A0A1H3PQ50_9BACI|nr:thioredoxin family protein [Evansella caseinilytica]SDZ03166.1 Thioredoxin domain-containing protein [Evansella caseinilytica]
MEVKLFINPNINGKIVEKRLMEVLGDIGLQVDLEVYHEDPPFTEGVFYTPTLIVDDRIVSSGKVLSKEEIIHFFL